MVILIPLFYKNGPSFIKAGQGFPKMAVMGGWEIFAGNRGKPGIRGWFCNGGMEVL